MLTELLAFCLIVGSKAFVPYSHLESNSHNQRFDPIEQSHRKGHQNNRIVKCDIDDFKNMIGFKELQILVEAVAARKVISPYIVLSRLLQRMRNTNMEDAVLNTLEGAALQELMKPEVERLPSHMPPGPNMAPYSISPMNNNGDNSPVYIVPVSQSTSVKSHNWMPPMMNPEINSRTEDNNPLFIVPLTPHYDMQNRIPGVMMKPEIKTRNEGQITMNAISQGEISQLLPVFPLMSTRMLKPPLRATVRVNTGNPHNPVPDMAITVSPLMTLVEALRQAEIKYQNALGLNHDSDVITFAQSQSVNCFVISRFDEVRKNEDLSWKVTVEDRDGQKVYEDFCLPDDKEVIIKPGTIISLSYVPL